ncbi:hypothetical protein [Neorhizobium alkalisoli]|uniref:hypothetical protein n=1 Tax=Neorhizobium alkalisoli TaxID=528178 RepID=UPI000CFA67AE|nr:hypothetical protein [Neorhizobium alkalisoli]
MSIASAKLPVFVLLTMAATSLGQQTAYAADLAGGYRERPRVVRTTYVRRNIQECSLLRVTEWDRSRIVEVCYPPLDLSPTPGRLSSSGDFFGGSSFTVTQSGDF